VQSLPFPKYYARMLEKHVPLQNPREAYLIGRISKGQQHQYFESSK
jgi:hypothetical protein